MSKGRRKWSEVSEDEAGAYQHGPARRAAAPATALVVVASLGLVANCLLGLGLSAFRQNQGPATPPPGVDKESYERGRASAPLFDCCLVVVPTLAVYPLVLAGGIQMRRLRSHSLAVAAAVLAMFPCSPAFLLGLPFGIWAFVVLLDPDVKAAFGRD
jgi:hypothetical protein